MTWALLVQVKAQCGNHDPVAWATEKLIWSDLVKLSGTRFWFFLFCAPAPHVPAGAARRDSHLA